MPARTGAGSPRCWLVLSGSAATWRRPRLARSASRRATDVFSRYLPYAIVFGEAERWAKVFATLAAAGGTAAAMPAVGWYTGVHAFSYGDFGRLGHRVLGQHVWLDLGGRGELEERVLRRRRVLRRWLRRWRRGRLVTVTGVLTSHSGSLAPDVLGRYWAATVGPRTRWTK